MGINILRLKVHFKNFKKINMWRLLSREERSGDFFSILYLYSNSSTKEYSSLLFMDGTDDLEFVSSNPTGDNF